MINLIPSPYVAHKSKQLLWEVPRIVGHCCRARRRDPHDKASNNKSASPRLAHGTPIGAKLRPKVFMTGNQQICTCIMPLGHILALTLKPHDTKDSRAQTPRDRPSEHRSQAKPWPSKRLPALAEPQPKGPPSQRFHDSGGCGAFWTGPVLVSDLHSSPTCGPPHPE